MEARIDINEVARRAAEETLRTLANGRNGLLHNLFKEVARETAKETIEETLSAFGLDTQNPQETQKDFALIRRLRMALEGIWISVIKTVFLGGMLGMGFYALMFMLEKSASK